jgi:hypothetical protein
MKFKNLRILLLLLVFPGLLMLKSCRKKCADNPATFPDYNCIQLTYADSTNLYKLYAPSILEIETNQTLKPSTYQYSFTTKPNFYGDYLPFDVEHSTNTFVFNDSSKLDTIIISNLNPTVINTNSDCGFQIKVNQFSINKNTFAKHAKCEWGNWNTDKQTITLKITF